MNVRMETNGAWGITRFGWDILDLAAVCRVEVNPHTMNNPDSNATVSALPRSPGAIITSPSPPPIGGPETQNALDLGCSRRDAPR